MRKLPTLPDLLPYYQTAVQSLRRDGALTVEKGVDLAVAFYREVRIGATVPGDATDEDLLLFQYGTQNWYDGRGEYFGLDITRQLIVEEDEEQLITQLSLEFEFDPAPFGACKSYNSWSTALPALAGWVTSQKATPGFTVAQANAFRDVNLRVQQV
jgi:hypothetical protein